MAFYCGITGMFSINTHIEEGMVYNEKNRQVWITTIRRIYFWYIHYITGIFTMTDTEKKIILITDLVDQRLRKEREIEYYEKELRKIEERLGYLYKEKTLTETILSIVQTENVVDIKEYIKSKALENKKND